MKTFWSSFIFMILYFLFSCSMGNAQWIENQSYLPSELQRKWMVVEYRDWQKQELIKQQAYIDLAPQDTNVFHAYAGCNTLSFRGNFQNQKVQILPVMSTEMYCQDAMVLENQLKEDLSKINHYQLNGQFLILSGNQVWIKLVVADWD